MTSNPLLTALRQYRHNHGEGFVFGYDKAETDRIVAKLVEALEEMIDVAQRVDGWESFPSAPIDRAEDAIRAYRKQGDDARVKSKTHIVQGLEVPDFRIEPKVGARYWYPTPASVLLCAQQVFRGNEFDIYRKENNLCYEDSESGEQAAILHAKAWMGGDL